ncbi:uncharacterized protein LOC107844531 [Capsicum annuum]|uniref:uncharacterized protein LOC107844531 n=1 Tax=Capsicum annuum TaxID=4072 RepID=UPI001FB195F7|nr:uncharacterized protein LOC107844531 [Capsicum annuum]
MLKVLSLNIPLLEALEQMLGYARFMKELVKKKRASSFEDVGGVYHCSAVTSKSLAQKKGDSGGFTIPFDRTVKKPVGISFDILVKVGNLIFPADFVILDCEVDFELPIIFGRQFMATSIAMFGMEKGELMFRVKQISRFQCLKNNEAAYQHEACFCDPLY